MSPAMHPAAATPPLPPAGRHLANLSIAAGFASLIWGAQRHFRRDGDVPPGMRVVGVATIAGFAWWCAARTLAPRAASPGAVRNRAAALLAATGCGLFWWAVAETRANPPTLAFSRDEPTFLVTTGPYALTRHPFYVSYAFFWTACAIASPISAFWIMPALMGSLYIRAAALEEAKFRASSLAQAYTDYRRRRRGTAAR